MLWPSSEENKVSRHILLLVFYSYILATRLASGPTSLCVSSAMTRYEEIQKAILDEIARPDFSAALPPLSDRGWLNILSTSQRAVMENERLEFLGDALMYATIARQLYQQIPYGTPGLYTVRWISRTRNLHADTSRRMFAPHYILTSLSRDWLRSSIYLLSVVGSSNH